MIAETKGSVIDIDKMDAAPGVLHRLLELTQTTDFDAGEAVGLLRSDPALTARVFALCRSVEMSRGSPPDTIEEAVLRIGARELYRMTLTLAMSHVTSQATHLYHGDSSYFWRRAVTTGVAMEESCPEGLPRPQAYTIGLMHLIGVWILCRRNPRSDSRIDSTDLIAMARFEKIRFGMAYAQVGAMALERWGFAKATVEAICWQNEPELAEDPAHAELAHSLRSAVGMAELALGLSDPASAGDSLDDDRCRLVERIKAKSEKMLKALAA